MKISQQKISQNTMNLKSDHYSQSLISGLKLAAYFERYNINSTTTTTPTSTTATTTTTTTTKTWLRKAMSTWRTILQVSKGKEKIFSKEIFIESGIFQGDSLSPILFGLAFIIISYTIRQMKLGYIPGPPGNRN